MVRMNGMAQMIERCEGPYGEVVLRRRGECFEIIANGCFLMDSSDGRSERLLISAALSVPQVTLLRACCRYLLQTGIPFSQSYMERVLGARAHSARALCLLFEQRLTPTVTRSASQRITLLERRIARAIEALISPDEDRILRAFLAVIRSTLRTNYFQRDAAGRPPRPRSPRLRSPSCPSRAGAWRSCGPAWTTSPWTAARGAARW